MTSGYHNMSVLADIPLWKFYILTYIIAISDFSETLTTCSFDTMLILLKIYVNFMINLIISESTKVLVSLIK